MKLRAKLNQGGESYPRMSGANLHRFIAGFEQGPLVSGNVAESEHAFLLNVSKVCAARLTEPCLQGRKLTECILMLICVYANDT